MSIDIQDNKGRNEKIEIQRRNLSEENKRNFFDNLMKINWIKLTEAKDTNLKYEIFLETYSSLFDFHFPLETVKLKKKDLLSPWITAGIKKSSKIKQKLYVKYLKDKKIRKSMQSTKVYLKS